MAEEVKAEEVKAEEVKGGNGADKEAEKGKEIKVGWWIEGGVLKVVAPLNNGYMSLGILFNALAHVNDRIEVNRLQQQENKNKLAGKDSMVDGLKSNPSMWKKLFKK